MLFIHAETFLSFYFEVLYSWNESFFQGFEIQEKGGWEDFEQANMVLPALMRTAGFVRRMTWISFLSFFLSFDFILFSTLADGWHFKQLEAHRKYSFMQGKKKRVFIYLPIHLTAPLAGGHFYALLWIVTV